MLWVTKHTPGATLFVLPTGMRLGEEWLAMSLVMDVWTIPLIVCCGWDCRVPCVLQEQWSALNIEP
jgi:hypothetical protein